MKIGIQKFLVILSVICFFIPDGLSAIGVDSVITNIIFLDTLSFKAIVKVLYWCRNLLGITFTIYFLLRKIQNKSFNLNFQKLDPLFFFFLFCLWVLFSSKYNNIGIYNAVITMTVCFGGACFFSYQIRRDAFTLLKIMSALFLVILAFNLIFAFIYPLGISTGKDYLSTKYYLLGTKNQATPFLMLMCMIYFIKRKRRESIRYFLILLLTIANVFIMGSSTGILCVVVFLFLGTILNGSSFNVIKKKHPFLLIVIFFLLSIGITFFSIQEAFSWLIEEILQKEVSLTGRTSIWNDAIKQFLDNPVIGYGYGHRVFKGLYAHNLILEVLVCFGIVGFLFYFLFVFTSIIKIKNNKTKYYALLIAAMVSIIIGNTSEAFIFNFSQIMMFCFISNLESEGKTHG